MTLEISLIKLMMTSQINPFYFSPDDVLHTLFNIIISYRHASVFIFCIFSKTFEEEQLYIKSLPLWDQ